MKKLLEDYFGKHYGSTKGVAAECKSLKGTFSFADPKACNCCLNKEECNQIVLNCKTGGCEVEAIQLEKFVDNYSNLKKITNYRKCDLLLVGEQKVVFCDMTCSYTKYIEPFTMQDGLTKIGKRAMAKEQLSNSIELLTGVPEIAAVIDPMDDKIALFAYREKETVKKDDFDAKTSMNMRKFGSIQEKALYEPLYTDMGNGFYFTEVRYPEVYEW